MKLNTHKSKNEEKGMEKMPNMISYITITGHCNSAEGGKRHWGQIMEQFNIPVSIKQGILLNKSSRPEPSGQRMTTGY